MNRRIKKQPDKKSKNYLFVILIVILIVLGLGQMHLSNRLAGWGEDLKKIEKQASVLEEENQRLKTKIITQRNTSSLEKIAKEKGFVDDPVVLNLTPKVPVALNQ